MVPRAADRVPHDEAFPERPSVVAAGRAHGKDVGAALGEEHRFAFGVADQGPTFRQPGGVHPLGQVRARQLGRTAH